MKLKKILLSTVIATVCVLSVCALLLNSLAQNTTENTVSSLRNIKSRLPSQASEMQALFPEGAFLTYTFYGTAWVNLGLVSHDPILKHEALSEAVWTYRELGSSSIVGQFAQSGLLENGVFYTGWQNRLLGGILLLQTAKDPELEKQFHSQSAMLAKAFANSAQPILPSYPDRAWPSDNMPALASLRLHDKLYGSSYTTEITEPWIIKVRHQYVLDTHLFPHQLNATTGEVAKTMRGASSAYLLSMLPEVDQELATQQYKLYQAEFVQHIGPISATKEYPKGITAKRNTNSGPLFEGFGATASVMNIAAGRVNSDIDQSERNSYFFSLIGLPTKQAATRQYLFGKLLVYDAVLMWSSTHLNWVELK